jgi:selT/selW/selH-like putative selenoprotein
VVAEIRERFGVGVVVDLEKGSRGVFDVHVDGTRVFSKHELHRFPDPGEIVGALAERT